MSPTSARDVAAKAAQGFPRLQCQECAEAIRAALVAAGHKGQVIEIRAQGDMDFMVCISFDGGWASITQNGRHLGVRVGDEAFDNLHSNGMDYEAWLKDFVAGVGVKVSYQTTDFWRSRCRTCLDLLQDMRRRNRNVHRSHHHPACR